MNKFFTFKRCASAMSLIAVTALSQDVLASGYAVRELSVYAQGSAYSGSSSSTDSITYMYFNPAMLVHQVGSQIESGALAIFPHSTANHAVGESVPFTFPTGYPPPYATITTTFPLGGATEVDNLGKYALTGNFYGMYEFCNDLKFGLAVTSPWGLVTDYDKNWAGRYQALHSDIKTVNITPMVSWRFNDQWSFGVGFQAQYMLAELTNKFGLPAAGLAFASDNAITSISEEPFARVQGYGWGYGFTAGIMYQPWEWTTVGISYRSQVAHELKHQKSEFLQPISAQVAGLEAIGATLEAEELSKLLLPIPYKVSATAKVRTPAQLNMGVTQYITDKWAVMADAQWTQWTNLNELRIHFEDGGPLLAEDEVVKTSWKNAWFGAVGTSYEYDCHWIFRGGVAYDATPVPSEELALPRVPDSNRWWLSVGATYHINYHFSVDASYSHIWAQDTSVHINTNTPQGQSAGTLDADYSNQYVNIVGLDVIYRF